MILTRSTRHPFDSNPPERKHGRVMVNMQKCQLLILLPQYKEEGITKFQKLRKIVPPYRICYL